jgi:hypothetical protein
MSADNWSVCPRCFSRAQKEAREKWENVMALYGQIPVDEFDRKRATLTEPKADSFITFREDYEFYGADEGEIHADYGGECSACGLSVTLKASKRFWTPEDGS